MKAIQLLWPAALTLALATTAVPVRASQRERGEHSRSNQSERSRTRDDRGARVGTAAPRGGGASRNERAYRDERAYRGERSYRDDYRVRDYRRERIVPRVIVPVVPYRHYGSYRPYVFRPRFLVGFGIYAGYPLPYPYAYRAPVYGYPGYPAPPPPPVGAPGAIAYGGLSFEISPAHAAVYVDGAYVGTVGQFYDPSQPLSLVAGVHRVEIQARGYQPLVFDVTIVAGQVIPYRGELRPY